MKNSDKDKLSKAEAQRRFEAALKGAMETPPTPAKDIRKSEKLKPPRRRKSKYGDR
jgi:hypothetical protein